MAMGKLSTHAPKRGPHLAQALEWALLNGYRPLNPWVTMIRRSWMTGTSIEATLELWESSLREVKGRMRPLFTQERVPSRQGRFWTAFLALSGARPAGCGLKRRAILAPGASRPFWAEDNGTPMRCATSCAPTCWRPWPIRTPWSSPRKAPRFDLGKVATVVRYRRNSCKPLQIMQNAARTIDT
jgi:hypothetical protein